MCAAVTASLITVVVKYVKHAGCFFFHHILNPVNMEKYLILFLVSLAGIGISVFLAVRKKKTFQYMWLASIFFMVLIVSVVGIARPPKPLTPPRCFNIETRDTLTTYSKMWVIPDRASTTDSSSIILWTLHEEYIIKNFKEIEGHWNDDYSIFWFKDGGCLELGCQEVVIHDSTGQEARYY